MSAPRQRLVLLDDGNVYQRWPDGSHDGPLTRCACPDGCSLGWGWYQGMCMACWRTYLGRLKSGEVDPSAPIEEYRLPKPADWPMSWGEWERMSSQEMGLAKRRVKAGWPPRGAPTMPLELWGVPEEGDKRP